MAVLSFFGTYRSNKKTECLRFKNKTMSLQACCSPLLKESWTKNPGKRVLPFTSHIRLKASMAVEAAFALPLFLFLALALMMPMKMLDTHRKLQTETERICEELSLPLLYQDFSVFGGMQEHMKNTIEIIPAVPMFGS